MWVFGVDPGRPLEHLHTHRLRHQLQRQGHEQLPLPLPRLLVDVLPGIAGLKRETNFCRPSGLSLTRRRVVLMLMLARRWGRSEMSGHVPTPAFPRPSGPPTNWS